MSEPEPVDEYFELLAEDYAKPEAGYFSQFLWKPPLTEEQKKHPELAFRIIHK